AARGEVGVRRGGIVGGRDRVGGGADAVEREAGGGAAVRDGAGGRRAERGVPLPHREGDGALVDDGGGGAAGCHLGRERDAGLTVGGGSAGDRGDGAGPVDRLGKRIAAALAAREVAGAGVPGNDLVGPGHQRGGRAARPPTGVERDRAAQGRPAHAIREGHRTGRAHR